MFIVSSAICLCLFRYFPVAVYAIAWLRTKHYLLRIFSIRAVALAHTLNGLFAKTQTPAGRRPQRSADDCEMNTNEPAEDALL